MGKQDDSGGADLEDFFKHLSKRRKSNEGQEESEFNDLNNQFRNIPDFQQNDPFDLRGNQETVLVCPDTDANKFSLTCQVGRCDDENSKAAFLEYYTSNDPDHEVNKVHKSCDKK